MIQEIIFINGIYDILCALSILRYINIPLLNTLHLSMFMKNQNQCPLFERILAYWIFTYGIIRLSGNSLLISLSYYMESLFIANECFINKTIELNKGLFVVVTSYALGYLSYLK